MTEAHEFWARVERSGLFDCWIWTGARTGRPGEEYGQLRWRGERIGAHRVAYELVVGPIPSGAVLDHLCRNHVCVNPAHLEPVTQRENILRGTGVAARHAKQTHCINGHSFADAYQRPTGGRDCRACGRRRKRERLSRRRLTGAAS